MTSTNQRLLACLLAAGLALSCGDDSDGAGAGDGGSAGEDPFGNAGNQSQPDGGGPRPSDFDANIPEPDCGNEPFGADVVPPNILLVIDQSGSMNQTPDGFDSDKWTALKASVQAALDSVQDDVALGLELFPVAGDSCGVQSGSTLSVDVKPGREALPEIVTALDGANPDGATPTAAALASALDYFENGAGRDLEGDKFVLLATDGGPNCNADASCDADRCTANLEGDCPMGVDNCCSAGAEVGCLDAGETRLQIDALAMAGIQTFVIGIPGSEVYSGSLDAFAEAGGRPNPDAPPSYFAASASGEGVDGLTGILERITAAVIRTCRLQLSEVPEGGPDALRKLNVEIEGETIPQGDNGWDLDETTDPPTIVMQGATCARIEDEGVDQVNVVFGCPTVVE